MQSKLRLLALALLINTVFNIAFSLTLEEAISHSKKHSDESLRIQSKLSSITAEKSSQISQNFLPSVAYYYNRVSSDTPEVTSGGKKYIDRGLEFRYDISNLYKGSFGVLSTNSGLNTQKFAEKISNNEFILGIIKSYFTILEAQKRLELLQQSLELNTKIYQMTQNMANRGMTKKSSAMIVLSEIEEITSNISLAENSLEVEKLNFFAKTGLEAKDLVEPKKPELEFTNVEDIVKKAKEENLEIKAAISKRNIAKHNLAYTGSDFLPDISITYKKSDQMLDDRSFEQSTLSLGFKFYLYKPGLISNTISKGYEYRSSNSDFAKTFKAIENKIRDLWAKYIYYQKIIKTKERIVEVRKVIATELDTDYRYGRVEIAIKLEEEKKLLEAEQELLKIKLESIINIFELKIASGLDI